MTRILAPGDTAIVAIKTLSSSYLAIGYLIVVNAGDPAPKDRTPVACIAYIGGCQASIVKATLALGPPAVMAQKAVFNTKHLEVIDADA